MKGVPAKLGNAGFTLVEALLATLLAGVVLGVLATLTAQWLPNWDRGFVRMQHADLLAVGLDRLLADLAAAEFVSDAEGNAPVFDGSASSVTFVRTAIGPNSFSGLEIVRIMEANDARGSALVRQAAPFVPAVGKAGTGAAGFSDPVVLVRAPHRVAFSYAGPDRIWKDKWHGLPLLPRAVRVLVRDDAIFGAGAVATGTLISAELPARCTAGKQLDDCRGPRAQARAAPAGGEAAGAGGQ